MISIILMSVSGTQNQHSFAPTLAKSSGGGAPIYLRLLRKAKTEAVLPLRRFRDGKNRAGGCDPHSDEVDFTASGWYIGGLSIRRTVREWINSSCSSWRTKIRCERCCDPNSK